MVLFMAIPGAAPTPPGTRGHGRTPSGPGGAEGHNSGGVGAPGGLHAWSPNKGHPGSLYPGGTPDTPLGLAGHIQGPVIWSVTKPGLYY